CGALQCALQIARSPILVRNALAQLFEPPYTDPYVRWCGRGGAERLPPIPIIGRQAEMAAARLSREPTSTGYPASLGTWGGKRLALRPGLRNDPIFRGGLSMGNPKVAIVAYCLAVGFILVVAFH